MAIIANNPKVSIIVPMYNVELYLRRCLDSLVNQTLKDIEIILVDDESPDNIFEIYEEYIDKDDRIKLVNKKNGGLGFARNSGLEIAKGEFVAFIDSDDYVETNMFKKLYDTSYENNLDTVYCGFNNVDSKLKSSPISEVSSFQVFESTKQINEVLLGMIASAPSVAKERKYRMSVWHAIYSRHLITKNKLKFCSEREFISEDIIFHIDYLTKAKKIGFIPDPLYYYCDNGGSLTKTFRKDRLPKHVAIYKEIMARLKLVTHDKQIVKHRVDRFFIGYSKFDIKGISNSNISFKEKKMLITKICCDPTWKLLSDYPFYLMNLKNMLIYVLIRFRMVRTLITLYKIF